MQPLVPLKRIFSDLKFKDVVWRPRQVSVSFSETNKVAFTDGTQHICQGPNWPCPIFPKYIVFCIKADIFHSYVLLPQRVTITIKANQKASHSFAKKLLFNHCVCVLVLLLIVKASLAPTSLPSVKLSAFPFSTLTHEVVRGQDSPAHYFLLPPYHQESSL